MVNGIFAAQIEYGGGGVEREKERYRESKIQTDIVRESGQKASKGDSTVSRLICVKHKTHTKVVKRNML